MDSYLNKINLLYSIQDKLHQLIQVLEIDDITNYNIDLIFKNIDKLKHLPATDLNKLNIDELLKIDDKKVYLLKDILTKHGISEKIIINSLTNSINSLELNEIEDLIKNLA